MAAYYIAALAAVFCTAVAQLLMKIGVSRAGARMAWRMYVNGCLLRARSRCPARPTN